MRLFALCMLPALAAALLAGEYTVTLTDHTGRGFAPDLVTYTIPRPANPAAVRVLDGAGAALPAQVTIGADGQAALSFVTALPPGATVRYTLRDDGQGPAAAPAVSATQDGDALILANQLLAVKTPAPQTKTFDRPVAAEALPAPILAFRGPDGAWRGAGSLRLKRPVTQFAVTRTAQGPVFTEVRYRLDYAGGGYYQATVRVTDRAPFAQVREEYDLGTDADTDCWQLDLSAGWQPDAAEHMNVAGQGNGPVQYPSLAQEEKAKPGNINPALNTDNGGDLPLRFIHHDSCWGSKFVAFYGIHAAAARKADPNQYPMAIVAPLHKGDWRRSPSLPVYVKDGQVRVQLPMATWPSSWLNEPRSDVSPFSCHEHDAALPVTYGRRVWALVLAKPAHHVTGYGDATTTASPAYAVRALYGIVGLDRYKDYLLEWPDTKATYPRVFTTPAWQAQPAEAVAPNFKVNTSGRSLPQSILYIMTSLSIHHHQTTGDFGGPIGNAEAALANPNLPEAQRRQLRAQLALLSYLLIEPDVTSAGNGSHHGNPNMGVSRLSDRSNLAALIPDHPMHSAWSEYMARFLAYKMGSFMAPEGGWFEYGASYHMHGYGKIARGIMGVLSSRPPQADQIWAYHRADMDYFLNLLSPVDTRYGSRTIPGTANSAVGQSPHYLQAMGTVADTDPAFAANLRWAWDQNGRMIGTGADGITIPAMIRPSIAAKEPTLASRVYPGFGVIFRAHQGPEETCLYLRSGYLWSHWNQDQGNLMLYAKGAVLLPSQPYQYGGPRDNAFPDKNFMRFGAPTNDFPHAWADSNVLDAHFSPSVDYAWASSGYPDWYITPGARAQWERANTRDLVAGLGQAEGAFTWDRQVLFLKGATPKSPNYFVIRDSTHGDGKLASWFNLSLLGRKANVTRDGGTVRLDTEWPTKLELLFTDRAEPAFELAEDDLPMQTGAYNTPTGTSRDWVGGKEQHVALRLRSAPGQEVAWVLYPRGAGEAAPKATRLAPGVTKIVTAEGTDYVFLSPRPLTYTGGGVEFSGLAGAVRVAKNGKATLVLSAGPGKVGYNGQVIAGTAPFERTVAAGKKTQTLPAPAWQVRQPAALPAARPVVAGVTKADADAVTQYVVDAPMAITAADGDVRLHARKATVECGKDAAGKHWARFVVPERAYVQLSVRDIGVRIAMTNRVFFTSLTLVAALATALVYGVGGNLVITGALTLGVMVALA
ncbi:MAG TPA: hypothetical protein PLZ36_01585, partial [Armatimonadota bacterium]|nr:hypothetical protein [Armatimonadota bacterium]